MATIKSFTDLSQSKVLAKFMPLESADMGWNVFVDETTRILPINDWDLVKNGSGNVKFYHAWSLAALLNYLKSKNKFPEIKELSDGRFALTTYIWDGEDCIQNSIGVTIVDACYDIIIKLYEQNLL